jgi:glycosyltransferase involved in cell wall biosynthesis
MSSNATFAVVDRHPSPLRTNQRRRVVEYRIPTWVGLLEVRGQAIAGFIEALVAFISLLICGGMELRRTKRTTVYVPTSEIPWVTFAGALLAWLFASRLVLTNQNIRIDLASKAGGLVGRLLWRIHARADQVIAVSQAIANELESVGVRGNVVVNPNGFERSRVQLNRREESKHAGIYIGRIEQAKGVDDLLNAWLLVTRRFPGANLCVVGYASSINRVRFAQQRSALGLDDVIEMIGVVPDATKWTLLAQSRICLFLSHIEGWGFVPLEALSIGLPVIVYDLPCYEESLTGLEGVFKVGLGDSTAAASEATRLLALTESEYLAMSDRIRSSFHYPDWSHIASTEVALINGSKLAT